MKIDIEKEFNDKVPTASLKFLTGSEAVRQALLETIEHVNAAEAERAMNEELRIRNEEIRDAHENGRIRNEDERIEAETAREGRENSRRAEEVAREVAESSRVEAERVRSDSEYDRVVAEGGRVSAENSRVTAENLRVSDENSRANAEKSRATAESSRANEEGTRVSNENTRKEAETTRVNAEKSRVSAETLRINNENARIDAENARAAKDQQRDAQIQTQNQKIDAQAQRISGVESEVYDLADAPRISSAKDRLGVVDILDRNTREKVYPATRPEAVVDKNGKNIIEIIEKYWSEGNTEEDVMYGVEWDVTVADTTMTRIGNMALHRQLPIHNRMKGCLLADDGTVTEYLNPTTWLGATRDGSRGQVEVELPDHYRKFETDGNIRRAKISEYPLPGYHYVPKMYISAYEATVQRSTGKLCSVVNSDPDYRGGDNTADWDGTYRSLLGRPATDLNSPTLRSYARNRKQGSTEWNMLTYDAYKALFWLYYIEYANRNCQRPFNAEKDSNGFSQGGLGDGATTLAYSETSNLNSFNPIIPCGYTDSLGNSSGTIPFDVEFAGGSTKRIFVARYRGIENPFGHIAKWIDGLRVRINGDQKASVYIAEDPALFNDEDFSEYRYAGIEPLSGEGHVKDILFGEYGDICCLEVGGSNTTYWSDRHQAGPSGTDSRTMATRWGGTLQGGWTCGLAFEYTYYVPLYNGKDTGTRLCFIPQNGK